MQVGGLGAATAVAAGSQHTMALLEGGGEVWAWGANSDGQFGDGTRDGRASSVQAAAIAGVSSLSSGQEHALAGSSPSTPSTAPATARAGTRPPTHTTGPPDHGCGRALLLGRRERQPGGAGE
jgi:hypothetical protein